jgi:O-antigen/teichoic acid export membrane protein
MVAVVVFIGLWFYFGRYKDTTVITRAQYLYYAVCYISGIQLTNFFTVLFYTKKNFFLPNFLMVLLNIIFIIIIPKQEGIEHTNPSIFIKLYFGYFMLTGLVLMIAFIIKNKSLQKISLPSLGSLKLLIRYALMALAANIIFFLVYRIDYWFVNRFCSAEELGNYIQVSKLGQMLLIIPTIISSVVFPHTAGGGGTKLSQMKDNILRIGRFTTVLYVLLFIIVLIIGKHFFPWIFGSTFQLMYLPFLILLPGIWALSNLFILSAYFGGVNKVKVNIQGACVGLVLILVGDLILIPIYGMYAAAFVSTIGYIATFLYSFLHIRKEYSVSITQYWSINKDDIKWLQATIKR